MASYITNFAQAKERLEVECEHEWKHKRERRKRVRMKDMTEKKFGMQSLAINIVGP